MRFFLVLWALVIFIPVTPLQAVPLQNQGTGLANLYIYQGDLDISTAVQIGLLHSPNITLGQLQRQAQEAQRLQAESLSQPKLGLSGFLAAQNMPMIYSSAADPNYLQTAANPATLNLNLMLMWPLYSGGAFQHRLEAATQAQRVALALEALSVQETVSNIQQAYLTVLAQRSLLDIAQSEQSARQELVRIVQLRLQAGRVARYVLLRAEAELASVEQSKNEAVARLSNAEVDLKTRMGIALESNFTYSDRLETPAAPLPLAQNLQQALQDRPDLIAARLAIKEGDERLLAALADYSPRLSFTAMSEVMRSDPFVSGPTQAGYSLGLIVSFPLYDGGQRYAAEMTGRYDVKKRQADLQATQLQALSQVANAQTRLETALKKVDLLAIEVQKNSEEYRLTCLRFEAGRGLYLEVLDGLSALIGSQKKQADNLYEAQLASVQLRLALGKLP